MIECPVAAAARNFPAAAAVAFGAETWTYADLDQRARAWHARLAGIPRVAVAQDNSPDLVALVFAAARAGTTVALLNTRLTPREQHVLREQIAPAPWASDLPARRPRAPGRVDPEAVLTLLFTSGTTGRPKAVPLTFANHLASARAANEVLHVDSRSRFVSCLPMFHVGGLAIAFRCAIAGGTVSLHDRFDAAAVAADLAGGATHASLVSSMLQRVLEHRRSFAPSLVGVAIGGGPVPKPLLERARAAGIPVLQTYGLTETASMATCERPGRADGSTAGPPLPGMEVRIEGGEIQVRGPAVMRGYLDSDPHAGWFATGDLGELDAAGRLVVHARRSDLILSGGENVYPAEIEAVLLSHPDVEEAAVVPVDDERWGQVGVAFVVARGKPDLDRFLRAHVAPFKVPARFVFESALPRLASGKVDRAQLSASAGRV